LTVAPAPALRIVTFAALDGGPWGAVWCAPDPLAVLGAAPPRTAGTLAGASLGGLDDRDDWHLVSAGVELTITGQAEPIHGGGNDDGFDQLCRVRGRAAFDGAEVAVDCLGRRGARVSLEPSRYDSIRDVSGWFEPDEGFALTALRPRRARGHGKDVIVAAVLDATAGKAVADPRLSTTYNGAGIPSRAGLELWLDDDEREQFPRRAAGESVGVGTAVHDRTSELRAELMHWHARGRDGSGVYLLARPA
jgi:hypothetical protein